MGSALDVSHITGLGTVDERMLILVDIDQLMSSADIGVIDTISA
jgi:purine-binding chemotaxis protein CheW